MFRLATIQDWWDVAHVPGLDFLKYPDELNSILKCSGYAYIISKILEYRPKRILEFGHGPTSPLFDLFGGTCEMWGVDATLVDYVTAKDLQQFRDWYENESNAKFIEGYLGDIDDQLDDQYFDFVCSVSTVEHIPTDKLGHVFQEIARVLRPGGIVANSYDVHYGLNSKPMFNAHEEAGFEWLEPNTNPVLNWDARDVCFEDQRNVLNYFMSYLPEAERLKSFPGNFATVLMAAQKPLNA